MAQQLRAERAASGMTVDQLAEKSGVPKRTLMRLLNEQRGIDIAHLASLADAVGLTLAEFVGRATARLSDPTTRDDHMLIAKTSDEDAGTSEFD